MAPPAEIHHEIAAAPAIETNCLVTRLPVIWTSPFSLTIDVADSRYRIMQGEAEQQATGSVAG